MVWYYIFWLCYLKIYQGDIDGGSSSKRKKLNPLEILETFGEKYCDIFDEKNAMSVEKNTLFDENDVLRNKLVRFTGKIKTVGSEF